MKVNAHMARTLAKHVLTMPYKIRPKISLRTRTATFKLPTAKAPGYFAAYGHLPAIAKPRPTKLTTKITVKNRLEIDEDPAYLWSRNYIPVTVVPNNPENPQGRLLLCRFGRGWRQPRNVGGGDRCILLERLHGEHVDVCCLVALGEVSDLRGADIQCPFLHLIISQSRFSRHFVCTEGCKRDYLLGQREKG